MSLEAEDIGPADPEDLNQVARLLQIFKNHGRTWKDEGGWRKKISFGKRNYMYK